MKKVLVLAVLSGALCLSGCVAVSQNETPKQFMDGSIITSSIKGRLANTAGMETLNLTVETLKGTVLLSGFAQNETQKRTAQEIAENTIGVDKVINHIVVQ